MKLRSMIVALGLLGAAAVGACSEEQDPGLTPATNAGPTTTSHTLPACSPDTTASIPLGGCIDRNGRVVNPGVTP
ncbi:MAG: hypothetical protein M3Z03_16120 [Actinomycetota bacterium]|nr:hypothetical protein [Actinomycetota bacterium]